MFVLLFILAITGCQTGDNDVTGLSANIKTTGVYTTLAVDPELDLPGRAYLSKNSFGPGERPAAVVVGFGSPTQPQSLSLEVIESKTGRSLFKNDFYASYGMAQIQPIAIRLSGDYTARILSGDKEWDNWQFSVVRTNSSGATAIDPANPGASYCKGIFEVEFHYPTQPTSLPDDYVNKLKYDILNAVTEDKSEQHFDLFAQRLPGQAVMHCRLNADGRMTTSAITENTLDDDCGKTFADILSKRSPYDAWPQDFHQKLGSDHVDLTVTVYLQ